MCSDRHLPDTVQTSSTPCQYVPVIQREPPWSKWEFINTYKITSKTMYTKQTSLYKNYGAIIMGEISKYRIFAFFKTHLAL